MARAASFDNAGDFARALRYHSAMERSLLPHIPIVLAVARQKSFARAAAELGLGASAVSHAVRALEDYLGEPLFVRTTRSVAFTAAGAAFLERVEAAFADLDAAAEAMRARRGEVSGELRINAPHVAASVILKPIVAELTRLYPGLTVELVSDNALTDVVGKGFDAGVRLGEMIAADMIAQRLTPPFSMVLAASPDYLARRGEPKALADLQGHNCIGYRLIGSGAIYDWELVDADGKEVEVAVAGTLRVSETLLAREFALDGLGIAYVAEFLIATDLAAGRLAQVLPRSAITEPGFFLYYPRRLKGASKLAALLQVARKFAARWPDQSARR